MSHINYVIYKIIYLSYINALYIIYIKILICYMYTINNEHNNKDIINGWTSMFSLIKPLRNMDIY